MQVELPLTSPLKLANWSSGFVENGPTCAGAESQVFEKQVHCQHSTCGRAMSYQLGLHTHIHVHVYIRNLCISASALDCLETM